LSPPTKKGTSAPSVAPIRASSLRGRPSRHNRFSANSTLAASELPPPRPPPIGIRLSIASVTPRGKPLASRSASRGAQRQVVRYGHAGDVVGAHDGAIVAHVERHDVREVDQREQRLDRVVAVGATSGDVQEQVDLRRRCDDHAFHGRVQGRHASTTMRTSTSG
jgi:hypothetical protein